MMTREEAIAVLEKEAIIIDDNSIEMTMREWDEFDDLKRDAIPVAIEALKAKTDDDIISREKAVNEIHKYFVEEIEKTPTEIDEDGDELYADMPTVNLLLACNKELSKRIKALPSAEPKTGEWVMLERVENVHDIYGVPTWGVNYMCDNCGFIHTAIQDHFSQYKHCPNCGARMCKGGELDD